MKDPVIVIICQTLATLGLGVNGILSIIMINIPDGDKIVAELLNTPYAPEIQIGLVSILCLFGTIGLTYANATTLRWKKEDPDEA